MRAWAFLLGGCLFVGIGVIGIFVPVLPTTPFLLLASFCFVRSSPRLNRWLMNHRVFGRYVRDWEEKRGVRSSVKVTAFTMMAVAAVATTVLAELPGWALGLMYGLIGVGAFVVWRLPTVRDAPALELQEEGAAP